MELKKTFYIDSCIWLNLFRKEGDESKGIPYWIYAKQFLEKDYQIIVTPLIIREVSFKLRDKLTAIIQFFKDHEFIRIIKVESKDYELARIYEKEDTYNLGFYDYLHVAIARRLDIPLITRDKELIIFARKYIQVYKPEELLY